MTKISNPGLVVFSLAAIATGLIFSLIVVLLSPLALKLLLWCFGFVGAGFWGSVFALLIVIFISCLAFSLRQHQPDIYGIVEIAFGAITATLALSQYAEYSSPASGAAQSASVLMPDTAKYAFAALSGLYVIVRGLDNVGKFMTDKSVSGTWAGRIWAALFVPSVKNSSPPQTRNEPTLLSK